ncbi:PREDICTED: two pore potassium channel protein sup-9 isoform X7 [Dinoponera quadriceps]|uniref:Two pore potassium channel protein sup-9 isoform X7 n=1 Tax=Dinoponera quadriceps TaxID=609295 RepID=A0A6P3XMG4_DINQU|nr:PREDICTED: two pore potassium channel protein sup-9 isoform X7 [Dinoponera quadriceps]XP_014479175.1 PREDICTED: two pore potassium channel protein sup-9 isoform X7 [Dinoponera quadriceps]XP_014479176.1 PREDICTED: two pore potassium channel protein sup-9 isoform X7 [Dinoponera quadriceps]XP_014479177.1 PREDICTED: two pore potassium channel protein sup-9 isoform X7 [Dinoponera quadriceps]XP_014479178.1 PREDICTED: two pore potassium channel protein sup-9 isoform X7 [Dinoponera quadriceps]XP_01
METDKPSSSSASRSWQRGSYRNRSGRRRKRRRKSWAERIADWTRALIAFLFSNVGIVCLVVGYTIAGAFLFIHIEGKTSPDVADDVIRLRNLTAATLWELTSKENVFSEKLWKAKVRDILESYQKKVVSAIKNGYDGVEENKWTFAGAFLYSLTVITTIGYGNICPRTKWGKVVTIVYAIVGMPLFLLYLSNIGDILARSFKWTYARCCLCRCRRKPYASPSAAASEVPNDPAAKRNRWQMVNAHGGEVDASSLDPEETSPRDDDDDGGGVDEGDGNDEDEDDGSDSYDPQHVTVPLTLCLAIMVGYIFGGAVLFSIWEDWNLLDGSYFCFVSLSTIGFGDFVPGDEIYAGQGLDLSFIFCSMYLMLGMALIAMCFNLMQEEVIAKMRALMRSIKYVFRCER